MISSQLGKKGFSKRFTHLYTLFAIFMGVFLVYLSFLISISQPTYGIYMVAGIGEQAATPEVEVVSITSDKKGLIISNNMETEITRVHARVNGKWWLNLEPESPISPSHFGVVPLGEELRGQEEIYLVAVTADGRAGDLYIQYNPKL